MFRFVRKSLELSPSIFRRNISVLRSNTDTTKVLSPACVEFLHELNNRCSSDYEECLELRKKVFDRRKYGFRSDTESIRNGDWVVDKSNFNDNLNNRHVEITGPANSKRMVINAFNSGASGYMLDLEDSMSPSWENVINGHDNIYHAIRKTIYDAKYDNDGNILKEYTINHGPLPTFFVRSRGLHMREYNVLDDNKNPISATIFDIGTHLFNNGWYLHKNYMGPYLYTPKLESYEDAQLINKIISESQKMLELPNGTTKTTVLIETFPAIFQTHEIIYALKDHIAGLNCGRWDYLFSMIKCLRSKTILPDKNILTMDKPFLNAYVQQIVSSCHSRGIHAMGGMSAFIPTNNKEENKAILEKINNDKLLEIERGCDGAWVAHPGLVDSMKSVFQDNLQADNQIHKNTTADLRENHFVNIGDNYNQYSFNVLQNNINISLQYISAWLSGNGAVALNNLMEDLATAEISVHQIRQWYKSSIFDLNKEKLDTIIDEEYQNVLNNNQVEYARSHFEDAKNILKDYIYDDDSHFLPDIASKHLHNVNGFTGISFDDSTLHRLGGSKGYLTGVELTKHRGEFLNRYLFTGEKPAYKFLGTSNGVSAVNVVSGGNGSVGPYAGGWQTNAMKNRLGMLLPDTLHVSPEEAANCAQEINNHLDRADCVQHIEKLNNPNFKGNVNYHDIALLADMEQGWNTPEKTRISVKRAIENGINVIHIEDQGEKKRCGHLGDKELNTYEEYAMILKSANLAAQEILGPEQAHKQYVRFVARTDAYSAKRIINSSKLTNPRHPEYKFIDWVRGPSPDGKYLYLKQGINPKTNNSWGLDLSIERGARVVDDGLASHVWMETPDADLSVARDFIFGVNKILSKKGKKAYGLYNHSPSFDWDVKFFADAEPLAEKITSFVNDKFHSKEWLPNDIQFSDVKEELRNAVSNLGDEVKGDHHFTDGNLHKIFINALDYYRGEENWNQNIEQLLRNNTNELTNHNNDISNYLRNTQNKGFSPKENITEIIVDQRLCNFSDMLHSFGFNMHLITLPEFHVTAFNMHKLSKEFSVDGINAFVKHTQRPERILSENDDDYSYYKHQTATGTGVEAAFSEAVGSSNVNILSDSTESDDLKKRA